MRRCKVEEISLLNTTVVRWDGVKVWYPNAKLNAEAVFNVTRSNPRWEGFKVEPTLKKFKIKVLRFFVGFRA